MTNFFEIYYSDLVEYATALIKKKNIQANPEDLVNEAFVKFYESGADFNFEEVKKIVLNEGFKEYAHSFTKTNFGDRIIAKPHDIDHRVCKVCHETKPANALRFFKLKGYNFVSNFCFDCEREKNNKWFKEWLTLPENRARWNTYVNNWRRKKGIVKGKARLKKPIHELWNKANRKYQAKQKEQLSDVYIRGILRASKKDFSPAAIEQKRKELFEKRRIANAVANLPKAEKSVA